MSRFFTLLLLLIYSFATCSTISWGDPVILSGPVASDPQVVMDANGNVMAAWVDNSTVCVSMQQASGSWSSPTVLGSQTSSSPRLGLDASGNVTAIWIQNGVVETATMPFGGSWSSPIALSSSGATSLVFAMDGNGDKAAAWIRNGFVESSTNPTSVGAWSVATVLSSSPSTDPDIGIGANGTICAAWHSSVSGADVIQAATQASGSTWNPTQTVTPISLFSYGYPKAAVDPNGNPTILFYQYLATGASYTNVGALLSSLVLGTWTAPLFLSNNQPGVSNPANLTARIAFDAAGNAMTLWSQSYDGSTFTIESAINPAGSGQWSMGESLGATILSYEGDMSMNSLLGAVAVYMAPDSSNAAIISKETSTAGIHPGAFWTPSVEVSASTTNNAYPRVASVYNGDTGMLYAVAVWINSTAGSICVAAATGSKTPIQPPSGLTVVQDSYDYGIFSEYHNTISWTASPAPDVNQYAVYRSGIFFALVNGGVFQVVDYNAVEEGSVTYGVAALESSFLESPIATVNYP